ncbi:hypothetical protein P2B08_17680 [Xanthomonas perforans]|uniref:hypothetical protein n=1 Tax=Xanthomonas perforans TaxID=442694 RepID=UPI000D693D34|nr:hypothetical protein [Xanthomonas perforans]PWH21643.1 hypothetical protein CDO09_20015 [Xanthomonas perforans]
MTVDAQQNNDGRVSFTLGTVERWIVGGAATLIAVVLGWFGSTVIATKSAVDKAATQQSVSELKEQQALTNDRLANITAQLADVPAMKLEMAKAQIKLDQHDQDIKELKQLRGLK